MFDAKVGDADIPQQSDKVVLLSDILSAIIDQYGDSLPHPLIFKIYNGMASAFVGVREFTAEDNTILIPDIIKAKINVSVGDPVTLELIEDVPKGTLLKLKPLHFYPEVHNWKYYLESNLTKFYTILNNHDKLIINNYELVIEDLNAPVVSIIDTDLVLDVVPLNDIMAHQQLSFNLDTSEEIKQETKILDIDPFTNFKVKVLKFDIMTITSSLLVTLKASDFYDADIVVGHDKLISLDNFSFTTIDKDFAVQQNGGSKTITIPFENIEEKINACKYDMEQGFELDDTNHWIYIVPFTWNQSQKIELEVKQVDQVEVVEDIGEIDTDIIVCANCGKLVHKNQFQLHEVFCLKNNIKCECGAVFLKEIPQDHWHCHICKEYSSSSVFKFKHDRIKHQVFKCDKCNDSTEYETLIDLVLNHKSTVCPNKLHECKFCHLVVEQEQSTYVDRFENLTHHENECGNKTDECYKCHKNIRRKDMRKHMGLHKLDTKMEFDVFKQTFEKCSNVNCVNASSPTNVFKLCEHCYGPLYNPLNDPTYSKLQSRIERKYMLQLNKGCDFNNCHNKYCKKNIQPPLGTIKDILKVINNELMTHIPYIPATKGKTITPQFWFCVNDSTSNKYMMYQSYINEYPAELILKGLNDLKSITEESLDSWLKQNS